MNWYTPDSVLLARNRGACILEVPIREVVL